MARRRSTLRRLAPCLVLTVAAHAAVLALPVRPARGEAPAVLALQVRTITPPLAVEPASPPPTVPPAPAVPPARAQPRPVVVAAPVPDPTHLPAERTVAEAADEVPFAEAVATPPVLPGLSLPGAATEDDVFLSRSLLTVPPLPLDPVLIPYPEFLGVGERYRGELTLFIDETGAVVRVRAEGEPLPAALEEAARQAFMAVRFAPGLLDAHGAVKSRIRVEVMFEGGTPLLQG